jgi:phytoene/squalene synthetase
MYLSDVDRYFVYQTGKTQAELRQTIGKAYITARRAETAADLADETITQAEHDTIMAELDAVSASQDWSGYQMRFSEAIEPV